MQQRRDDIAAVGAVAQKDVALLQARKKLLDEEPQFVAMQGACGLIENSPADQGKQNGNAHKGKSRAGRQTVAGRESGAVFGGVRQAAATAVNGANRTILEQRLCRGSCGVLCAAEALEEDLFEQAKCELVARLAVSGSAFIDLARAVKSKESLNLAHDLATGAMRLEDLPNPAPDGAGQGIDAFSGMVIFGILAEQRGRKRWGEALLDLGQRRLAQAAHKAGGAAAESGEAWPP